MTDTETTVFREKNLKKASDPEQLDGYPDTGDGSVVTVPSVTFQQADYGSMSGSAAECQTEKTLTRREISGLFFSRAAGNPLIKKTDCQAQEECDC